MSTPTASDHDQTQPILPSKELAKTPHFDGEDASLEAYVRSLAVNHMPHIYSRLGSLEGKMAVLVGLLMLVAGGVISLVVNMLNGG